MILQTEYFTSLCPVILAATIFESLNNTLFEMPECVGSLAKVVIYIRE